MIKLKKYDFSGKEIEEISIDCSVKKAANTQMVKDYIVALRQNARQWSANTRGRSEVKASGKKPHRQKGTGRARQGCLAAPQYKGGGVVFGPKPKFDQNIRINSKERRAVVQSILLQKMEQGEVIVLQEQFSEVFNGPKTKVASDFLKAIGFTGKKLLFLGSSQCLEEGETTKKPSERYEMFSKSVRNIPKVHFTLLANSSGMDLMKPHCIVVFDSAVSELKQVFQS